MDDEAGQSLALWLVPTLAVVGGGLATVAEVWWLAATLGGLYCAAVLVLFVRGDERKPPKVTS